MGGRGASMAHQVAFPNERRAKSELGRISGKNSGKILRLQKPGQEDIFFEYKKSQYEIRRGDEKMTLDKSRAEKNLESLFDLGFFKAR